MNFWFPLNHKYKNIFTIIVLGFHMNLEQLCYYCISGHICPGSIHLWENLSQQYNGWETYVSIVKIATSDDDKWDLSVPTNYQPISFAHAQ